MFEQFIRMNHSSHQNYKNDYTEMEYQIIYIKPRTLKVKNSLSELKKDFKELKDRELRDKETKIKKEMEEHFFELVNVSIDDMDKFEKN